MGADAMAGGAQGGLRRPGPQREAIMKKPAAERLETALGYWPLNKVWLLCVALDCQAQALGVAVRDGLTQALAAGFTEEDEAIQMMDAQRMNLLAWKSQLVA